MKFLEMKMRLIAPRDPGYSVAARKFHSMRKYSLILLLAVFGLPIRSGASVCTGTGATIYVSTFSGNQILKITDTCPATVTVIYTNTTASPAFLPEDIAVGPDNKVYVCDSIASRIWRIDPSTNTTVKIYDASTATAPNNPHGVEGPSFNSAGDLFMNSRSDSGTPHGIWKIAGPANISDSGPFTPVQVFDNAFFGEGTVFDSGNNLDLVNSNGNQILQSSPPYNMENILPTASGLLSAPIGIAANPQVNAAVGFSQNDIFVANTGLLNINHFSSTGTFANTYATFTSPDFPAYMEFDPSNNLFVVTAQDGQGGHGKVWRIPPSAAPATPVLVVDLNTVFLSNTVTGLLSDKAVGLAVATQVQSAPPQTTGASTTNTFTFDTGAGNQVTHTLAFGADAVIPTGVDAATLMIQSTNNLISNGTVDAAIWAQYTGGGPFATSVLFVKAGDNNAGGGTDLGSLYADLCFDKNHPTPSDAVCPTSASGINIQDIFDIAGTKPPIAPNTTAGMPHFFPLNSGQTAWTASALGSVNPACTNTLGATGGTPPQPPINCDVSDVQAFILSGDQGGAGGRVGRKGSFATVNNIPMLESLVSANGTPVNTPGVQGTGITWFNTSSLNLDFKVNPGGCLFNPPMSPCPPASNAGNNFFVPAPVASETYGVTGATTIADTAAGPAPDTSTVHQADFNTNPVALNEGVNVLHWEAIDNVDIQEQNIQLIKPPSTGPCPNPYTLSPPPTPPCYSTTLFSAQIGVDTLSPSITVTTPAAGAIYPVNHAIPAAYTCTDSESGVASCVGTVPFGSNIDTTSNGVSTPKTFTVNSKDNVGNISPTKMVNYTVSCHYAALGISPSIIKRPVWVTWITVTSNIMDCVPAAQAVKVKFTLSGPLGDHCSTSSTVMFTTPQFTIQAGTSKSTSFPFPIFHNACAGTYTVTTTTLQGALTLDSTSTMLTITN